MKKTIALLLAVLMILSMVACAANTPAKTEEPATTQTETTTPDTTETEEPAATEEPATEEHEPATLEVFLAQVDWADAWDELEARFEEQHPWISIEHVGLGADADFLQQRLAANDLPDAIQLNNGVMMNAMVEQNLLTDLTNWECAKVMPKAYADAYTFDGKLVGMCQGAAFSTMFYNMDILNEAGWDTVPTCWDELIQCCKDIKEKTGVYTFSFLVNNLSGPTWPAKSSATTRMISRTARSTSPSIPKRPPACRRSPRTSSRAPLPLWKKMLLPTCLTVWPRCASPATGTAA